MPISPLCLVQDGAGAFVATTNGVNVTLGNVISVKLVDPTGVVDWYLEVTGSDELSTPPPLTNVNPITNKVVSPATIASFTMPSARGRAFLLTSTVVDGSGSLATSFAVYTVTALGARVAAAGETVEGNSIFGWATVVNPLVRSGAPVLRYDDTLALPALGTNTVQGAIDALKAAAPPATPPGSLSVTIDGEYSTAITPSFFDPPFVIDAASTISRVRVIRRTAGTGGQTEVDILKNGVSIFAAPANRPKVTAASGNNAQGSFSTFAPGAASLVAGDVLEVRLLSVETFLVGPPPGPEGVRVSIFFA